MAKGRAGQPRSGSRATGAPAPSEADRFQIGDFWLWYRSDRDRWDICWLEGRTTRRRSTGIRGGTPDCPPDAAKKALAERALEAEEHADRVAPVGPKHPHEVLLATVTRRWLKEHVADLDEPRRYADSVLVLGRFYEAQRRLPPDKRVLVEPLTIANVTNALVDAFIEFRRAEGVSPPGISRDLAALRSPINWARRQNLVTAVPFVKDVKGKDKKREKEWNPEQIAAIIEAAWASVERQHVHLYSIVHLSTHGRHEAILEFDCDTQYRRGLLFFNAPDRDQTRKRRSIVPACPTLAPWMEGRKGKLIVYRVPIARKRWADPEVPEYFERPTENIDNAFGGVLLEAHRRHPSLGFATPKLDDGGREIWLPPRRKLGETEPRLDMRPLGSPNVLRHSIHTWHKTMGVPDAQIDAASGHSEEGTGANYTHLRPEYLKDFIASTEAFWEAVGEFTDVHLRYRRDTKVFNLASARTRG